MNEVVIVSACRTPIGKFMGSLKDVSAKELAVTAGAEAIRRANVDPGIIDEICMGQVYGHLQGSLPARQVAMKLGLPIRSVAVNVNQNCSSSMRALEIASHKIMLGQSEISLVVGVESMTNAPYMLPKARSGYRMGPGTIEDAILHDGLYDAMVPGHMGLTAENVAEKYSISREECDELAWLSHTRALTAIAEGRFKREIVPVEIKSKKGVQLFDTDEHPMQNVSLEVLSKLPSAFKKGGVVTAGNASGVNDGASAVVLMSRKKAEEMGIKPLLSLINICGEGVAPEIMGVGPAVAIPKCLNQVGIDFDDVNYWEINEAFAAQFIGVERMLQADFGLNLDLDKVNHNGSGIALGHPVGNTGLRLVVSLYYELERLNLSIGGASMCVGGGPAMASLWKRETV